VLRGIAATMLKTQPIGEALIFGALGVPLTMDAHQYVALAHGSDVEEAVGKEEESNSNSCWLGVLCQKVMRSCQLLLSCHILPPTPQRYSSTPPKQARPTKLTSVNSDFCRT